MTGFQPGETVSYTVENVRVVGVGALTGAVSTIATDDGTEYPVPPQAAVTRIAPVEWPPEPGDLWRDRTGAIWFASSEHRLCTPGTVRDEEANRLNQTRGPLTLVHREYLNECACELHTAHAACVPGCGCEDES